MHLQVHGWVMTKGILKKTPVLSTAGSAGDGDNEMSSKSPSASAMLKSSLSQDEFDAKRNSGDFEYSSIHILG